MGGHASLRCTFYSYPIFKIYCTFGYIIVCVCLCLPLTCSGGELLLASCSQDCLIRLWRLRPKSGMDARVEDDVIRMTEDVFEVTDGGAFFLKKQKNKRVEFGLKRGGSLVGNEARAP